MYPGMSDEDLLSLFGDPNNAGCKVNPEYESRFFGG